MKKIYSLIIAVLVTAGIANAQSGWVNHVADERISLKFPAQPQELTPGSFSASDADGVAYVFTMVDFVKVAGIDSVALAPMKATPEFAAQLKTGINQSLPDVKLADFTISTWHGFTSYSSTGLDSKNKRYDMFMFIIGNKLYSLSTVATASAGSMAHDRFLDSVKLSN